MKKKVLRLLTIGSILTGMTILFSIPSPALYSDVSKEKVPVPALSEESWMDDSSMASVVSAKAAKKYLFIGDSRFVGMESCLPEEDHVVWLDRVGVGHSFFFRNIEDIDDYSRDTIVIYELGVNDLDAERCVEALNDLVSLGFEHIWFTTVGPVDEYQTNSYGYEVTNQQIEEFNQEVVENLPPKVGVIDVYHHLLRSGIETEDGLHYMASTYLEWYQFMMNTVNNKG